MVKNSCTTGGWRLFPARRHRFVGKSLRHDSTVVSGSDPRRELIKLSPKWR